MTDYVKLSLKRRMYLKQCVKNFIGTKILLVRGYHVVHHPNCGIIRNHATNKPRSRFSQIFVLNLI